MMYIYNDSVCISETNINHHHSKKIIIQFHNEYYFVLSERPRLKCPDTVFWNARLTFPGH